MTLNDKNNWRLRFKQFSMVLASSVVLGALILDVMDKDGKNLIGIAPSLFVFIAAVFGVDYFSKPSEEKE